MVFQDVRFPFAGAFIHLQRKVSSVTEQPNAHGTDETRTDLIAVLTEVIPVRLDDRKRQLRNVVDSHLRVTLGQMIDLHIEKQLKRLEFKTKLEKMNPQRRAG